MGLLRLHTCPSDLTPSAQENIFEWQFVIRGAWDTEFQVRVCGCMCVCRMGAHR